MSLENKKNKCIVCSARCEIDLVMCKYGLNTLDVENGYSYWKCVCKETEIKNAKLLRDYFKMQIYYLSSSCDDEVMIEHQKEICDKYNFYNDKHARLSK